MNDFELLLIREYEREWVVIDGLLQHPEGLNFWEWLNKHHIQGPTSPQRMGDKRRQSQDYTYDPYRD